MQLFRLPTSAEPDRKWQSCLLLVLTMWPPPEEEDEGGSGGRPLGIAPPRSDPPSPKSMSLMNQVKGASETGDPGWEDRLWWPRPPQFDDVIVLALSAARAAVKRPGLVRLASERRSPSRGAL